MVTKYQIDNNYIHDVVRVLTNENATESGVLLSSEPCTHRPALNDDRRGQVPQPSADPNNRVPHKCLRFRACFLGQSAVISSDHSNSFGSRPQLAINRARR
jgi:hypothetical protein